MDDTPPLMVGVVGTGFVSRNFCAAFHGRQNLHVKRVLTRRPFAGIDDHPCPDALTSSMDDLLSSCDVVLECSGDAVHATDVIDAALSAGLPVVTMNAEFHVTAGSYYARRGRLSEAEGDQPGALAALHRSACEMGFAPLAYVNLKGFLNRTPTLDEMRSWADKQGISLPMVTASTDGTKVQIEQALVANYAGATILCQGLLGPEDRDIERGARTLATTARQLGQSISDYLLCPGGPHGVLIVAGHDPGQAAPLEYFKLGAGPDYVLLRPNIFVHLEIPRTLLDLVYRDVVLMDNSSCPSISVAAIAKRPIPAHTKIPVAIGSFDLRGEAVRIVDAPGHVPIGLVQGAVVRHGIDTGAMLTWSDVDIPPSRALNAWRAICEQVLGVTSA